VEPRSDHHGFAVSISDSDRGSPPLRHSCAAQQDPAVSVVAPHSASSHCSAAVGVFASLDRRTSSNVSFRPSEPHWNPTPYAVKSEARLAIELWLWSVRAAEGGGGLTYSAPRATRTGVSAAMYIGAPRDIQLREEPHAPSHVAAVNPQPQRAMRSCTCSPRYSAPPW